MDLSLFDYDIEPSRIAQKPVEPRDAAKLLVADRKTGVLTHTIFRDIVSHFSEGDVLVLNDTKVMKCRLHGKKKTGGKVELLLLRESGDGRWESLVKPSSRLRAGTEIHFKNGTSAQLVSRNGNGLWHVEFRGAQAENIFEAEGEMPLPPYIHSRASKDSDYQTVYAQSTGSAAAPTAGLHFTDDLLQKIKNAGMNIVYTTLHVHLDTFRPICEDNIQNHKIHSEYCDVPPEAADKINAAKQNGKKVFACGTTVARALESAALKSKRGIFESFSGFTELYITPGFSFRVVDALITNFHFPRSTLLVLVSAFMGYNFMRESYNEAMENDYRFFSFGDAMLIT